MAISKRNLIFLGAPGSGKGTMAAALREVEPLAHISTGDLLRDEIKRDTALGREAAGIMKAGGLVSDDIVCGMVRNEGEPGGGPFWVSAPDGSQSLQIAESSQIAPEQRDLMQAATHFNPVDVVCDTKNYRNERFDLRKYVDPMTGFISHKSKNGRELLAQELPGLWNGSMAHWNTIFVEVPITTFSPVKVVGDLLRPQHQSK